jgi:L-lactate dehydrogenase complex protein LldF
MAVRASKFWLFVKTAGENQVHYLAEAQREATRPLILAADAGMTGCNFAVAETGTFVVCTNEGNADLSANVPKLHIASIGIEKIIPRFEHLAVFVRLLSRSALGSPVTQYTSYFRGPREGGEMHIVLVDNGRSGGADAALARAEGCWTFDARDRVPRPSRATAHHLV